MFAYGAIGRKVNRGLGIGALARQPSREISRLPGVRANLAADAEPDRQVVRQKCDGLLSRLRNFRLLPIAIGNLLPLEGIVFPAE
jgi:hypothetical protein